MRTFSALALLAAATAHAEPPARVFISTRELPTISAVAVGGKVVATVAFRLDDRLVLDVDTSQDVRTLPGLVARKRQAVIERMTAELDRPGADAKAVRERFEPELEAAGHFLLAGKLGAVSDGSATFAGKVRAFPDAAPRGLPPGKALVEGEAAAGPTGVSLAIRNGDGLILVTGRAAGPRAGTVRVVGNLTLDAKGRLVIEADDVEEVKE